MIGRIACFLEGDDYGTLSSICGHYDFRMAAIHLSNMLKWDGFLRTDDFSLPVHPVQLYGCLKGLGLFILFSVLWEEKSLQTRGVVFPVWNVLFLLSVCS